LSPDATAPRTWVRVALRVASTCARGRAGRGGHGVDQLRTVHQFLHGGHGGACGDRGMSESRVGARHAGAGSARSPGGERDAGGLPSSSPSPTPVSSPPVDNPSVAGCDGVVYRPTGDRTLTTPICEDHPVARTWLSIRVELVDGGGRTLWPRPGRVFAAARSHSFAQLATAIDDAFARWDRAHLHMFDLGGVAGLLIDRYWDDPPDNSRVDDTVKLSTLDRRAAVRLRLRPR